MTRYLAWSVFKGGLRGGKGWGHAGRPPKAKHDYDVVIRAAAAMAHIQGRPIP